MKPESDSALQRSRADRLEAGKALRQTVPLSAHREWFPTSTRPDVIELLEISSQGRIPELIPIRYGRMLASPFAFLRGSAVIMAVVAVAPLPTPMLALVTPRSSVAMLVRLTLLIKLLQTLVLLMPTKSSVITRSSWLR